LLLYITSTQIIQFENWYRTIRKYLNSAIPEWKSELATGYKVTNKTLT